MRFSAALTGAQEVPMRGDANGYGGAGVVIDTARGELCFALEVYGIKLPAAAAHIHRGARGVAGPVVVPLIAPMANGKSDGCATAENQAERDLFRAISANPAGFYVNVHTSEFPQGAIRGQLVRVTNSTAPAQLPNTGASDASVPLLAGLALLTITAGLGLRRRARFI
jgi:LPXTG-motif cell wall-anchored protein